MDYTTLYDVSQQSPLASFPWIVLLLPAGGVLFLYQNRDTQASRKAFIIVWLFVAFACTLILLLTTTITSSRYATIVRQGHCSTLTGPIENFIPPPRDRKPAYESFTLQYARFAYTDGIDTGAFNSTGAWNNLLRNGLNVRICYVAEGIEPQDKRILKLEVLTDDLTRIRLEQ